MEILHNKRCGKSRNCLAFLEENGKEFTVFGKYLGIGTVKRPIPVEKVIAAGCHCKPDGIGDVFLNSYNLFKKPGEAEINENAGETNNPEFEKFQNELH